jgi:dUTP pyrophosphatase
MSVVNCVLESTSVMPTKGTKDSVGYDLTALSVYKKLSDKTTLFDTGLKIKPPKGYYIEIIPRSSLSKTGYMLSNSVGIIDPDYTDRLLIALTKVDDTLPDISLPFTKCQMILRKHEDYTFSRVEKLEDTDRKGGFGSTDLK